MNLYLVSLTTAIGRSKNHALWWTYARFLTLIGLAFGCSLGLAGKPVPATSNHLNFGICLITIFSVEVIFVMVLLGSANFFKYTRFTALLSLLPLKRAHRTAALLIPDISICLLVLTVAYLPFRSSLLTLGLPTWLINTCVVGGLLSSFGLVYGLRTKKNHIAVCLGFLFLQVGASKLVFSTSFHAVGIIALTCCVLILVASCLRISRACNKMLAQRASKPAGVRLSLPTRLWMLQKIFGNKRSFLGLATTGAYVIGLVGLNLKHYIPPSALFVLASLLAAAFMSDIRGISRKYLPAEIANLKGTAYFIQHLGYGFVCAFVLFTPVLLTASHTEASQKVLFASQLVLGLSIGLLSSSIFVPQDKDIHGQFITILLALCLLVILPQLPFIQTHSPPVLASYNFALALGSIAMSYWLEYKRNTFFWR